MVSRRRERRLRQNEPHAHAQDSALHDPAGGWAREVTVRDLPVAKSMAGVNMRLDPGAVRELHWHKEAEWAYILEGNVRFTVVDEDRNVYIDDLKPGDMWLAPAGIPHSI